MNWFMLMKQNEYTELKSYKPMVEPIDSDANLNLFVENLLLPENFLSNYIQYDKTFKQRPLYDKVDILKSHFKVSYELILKRLFKLKYLSDLDSFESAKKHYLTQVKTLYEELNESLPIKHGEPSPLPLTVRGRDFFECAVIAAWKKGLDGFSSEETSMLINCDEKYLEKKYSTLSYLIDAMLN